MEMAITLTELKARLAAKFDEVTLLEILNLQSVDIVDAFSDLVEEKQEELSKLFDEDEEFSHDYSQKD
jgi:hypothetical protein